MQYVTQILPYQLHFKKPARTSRGIYHHHQIWYVIVRSTHNPEHYGIGECAPLPDLSCDYSSEYVKHLQRACQQLEQTGEINYADYGHFPSILFGLETALRHFQQQSAPLWDTTFTQGKSPISINGLIWMDDYRAMLAQIEDKITHGFKCIKLKIGALDFADELHVIKTIRHHFSAKDITLRLDANGAFHPDEALSKLAQLAKWDIHSIEQPIAAKQWQAMATLIEQSPLPIALDEELIGVHTQSEKMALLATLKPHYLILKPSLHGGIRGTAQWISLAEKQHIPWWITSALESNIGLNCIAQFASQYHNSLPQGLGTGLLYHNNVPLPLTIKQGQLHYQTTPCVDWRPIMALIQQPTKVITA